jgi:hypothetical protein
VTDYAGRLRCRDHPDYAVTWRGTGCARSAVEARRRRDERKTTTENGSKRDPMAMTSPIPRGRVTDVNPLPPTSVSPAAFSRVSFKVTLENVTGCDRCQLDGL